MSRIAKEGGERVVIVGVSDMSVLCVDLRRDMSELSRWPLPQLPQAIDKRPQREVAWGTARDRTAHNSPNHTKRGAE